MKTFFQDEFINSRLLKRLTKEIRKEQLDKTIDEISNFNEIQIRTASKSEYMTKEAPKTSFINRFNNGR
ncbi:MAG: hypothetical protein IJ003_04910 [Candidatus Gastranaerophilales bacterium]|nr:hypothetical protein [Candidatus Gastranaerophilales bacterium]